MTWITSLLRRPPIGWWDLVDILVVSALIYEILKLIRGTRAMQMAVGAGFIAALFYVSRWGHLETVNWLVRNMVGYLVFAVIVLFQSDIRRALAHLGRAPFFRYFAKQESAEESIEELVVAASMLSRHRAAIGLTEENDSVAIVVSEETGSISLVADGQIVRGLDADSLRAQLRSLVLQRQPAPKAARPVQYT
jgi:DNA integrity scanning protein DisA with diadenylate cyclase activity